MQISSNRIRRDTFGCVCGGGGAGGWRNFSSEGVTIFCRVKEELELEDSKQSRQQCSLRRHRQGSAGLSQLQCIGFRTSMVDS